MKYRKKPVVIEAEQFFGNGKTVKGVCLKLCLDGDLIKPHVHTIHNNQSVILTQGDWVIPEPDGIHYYPCKPNIFDATYESVD